MKTRGISVLMALLLLAGQVMPVMAGFGDFFDENGNLKPGVVDLGIQRVPADWMPDPPDWAPDFIKSAFEATYHVYALPSGETVLLPSATTLFFMAANPRESGLIATEQQINFGWGMFIRSFGSVANHSPQDYLTAIFNALGMDIPYAREFADAIIQGKDVWSSLREKDTWDIFKILLDAMKHDKQALYFAALLYGNCAQSPVGCPEALVRLMTPQPTPDRVVQLCGAPSVTRGQISASARKVAPNYALVVGQDPEQRGVDLQFTLTIGPTIYTYYTLHEWQEARCVDSRGRTVKVKDPVEKNCVAPYKLEWRTRYTCEQHTQTYCEPVRTVSALASLKPSSRDWILNELAQWYPGATLYHPDWKFSGGSGGCDGGNTFTWRLTQNRVQVRDPGFYALSVSGVTAGTPITPPRPFRLDAGEFDVYLMETTVVK